MDLHPGLMIWTIISFVILLWILSRVAWKPILKALDEREQGIKDNIKAAEEARAAADQSLEEYKKRLAEAQAEAQALVSKARQDAERVRDDLLAKSKAESEQIVAQAAKRIELERKEAIASIRSEVADLVVDSVRKVIGKTLTKEDHKRLIMDSLKESPN